MGRARHLALAVLFGGFAGIVGMVVQVVATALMGTPINGAVVVAAACGGAGMVIVGVLTVLVVWPRIGFDPFDSHPRGTTSS